MLRLGILSIVAVSALVVAQEANAQVIIGPAFFPNNTRSRVHDQLAQREWQRQWQHAAAHRQGLTPVQHARLHRRLNRDRALDSLVHDDFHFGPSSPPVVFLPPPTRAAIDPFGGHPSSGNYYYWLSREYAQGRVSKAEYNRQVYGVGRK